MKTFKVIGVLALVFVAGFAGGVVATRIVVRQMVANAIAHPAGAGARSRRIWIVNCAWIRSSGNECTKS